MSDDYDKINYIDDYFDNNSNISNSYAGFANLNSNMLKNSIKNNSDKDNNKKDDNQNNGDFDNDFFLVKLCDEKNTEIEILKQQICDLSKENSELKTSVKELKEDGINLTDNNYDLLESKCNLENKINDLEKINKKLIFENNILQEGFNVVFKENKDFMNKNNNLIGKNNDLLIRNIELENVTASIPILKDSIEVLSNDLRYFKTKLNQEYNDINDINEANSTLYAKLFDEHEALKIEYLKLQKQSGIKTNDSDIEYILSLVKDDINRLKTENSELITINKKLDDLVSIERSNYLSLENHFNDMILDNEEKGELFLDNQQLREEIIIYRERNSELIKKNNTLIKQINNNLNDYNSKLVADSTIEIEHHKLREENENLKRKVKDLSYTNNELYDLYSNILFSQSYRDDKIHKLEEENNALKDKLSKLSSLFQ